MFVDERSTNPRVAVSTALAQEQGVPVEPVRRFRLDDMASGTAHQGVVAALRSEPPMDEARLRTAVEAALQAGAAPVILVLDDVQDPHNLGACLRTADATGVMAVVVPRRGAAGLTPAVRKVASGGAETVPLVQVNALGKTLDWLAGYGFLVAGTGDQGSTTPWALDCRRPLALVMGAEGAGLSPGLASRCEVLAALPMAGSVESLNVSVATGVMLYEVVRQRDARAPCSD